MKKIVLITLDFPPEKGGIQRVLYNIVNNVACGERSRTKGIEVIAPYVAGSLEFDKRQRFKIHRVHFIPHFKKSALLTLLLKALVLRADLIIYGHVVASIIGLFIPKPNVIFTYGIEIMQNKYKSIFTHLLKRATKIITISEFTKSFLLKKGINSNKVVKIYPSIDTSAFNPDIDPIPVIDKYNLNGREVILTVSRMDKKEQYKGYEILIRILPKILAKRPKAFWVVVGTGSDRQRIEKLVKEAGLGSYVLFTGKLREENLLPLYTASHLFVMPGEERKNKHGVKAEGFGMVYAEANACGKPAIGYKTGGVVEAIIDGVTGILVNNGDEESLANAITTLLCDKELAQKMGTAGRKRTVEELDVKIIAKQFEQVLAQITKELK